MLDSSNHLSCRPFFDSFNSFDSIQVQVYVCLLYVTFPYRVPYLASIPMCTSLRYHSIHDVILTHIQSTFISVVQIHHTTSMHPSYFNQNQSSMVDLSLHFLYHQRMPIFSLMDHSIFDFFLTNTTYRYRSFQYLSWYLDRSVRSSQFQF